MTDAPNLELLRMMSPQQLVLHYGGFVGDLALTRKGSRRAKYTADFCETHIAAIDQVLGEKGITPAERDRLLRELTA